MKHKSIPYSIFLFGILTVLTTGCGSPQASQNTESQISVQQKQDVSQEFSIKSAEGGAVELSPQDGSRVKIVFPQESLENDSVLEVRALSAEGSDVLSSGFSLNQKGTDQGPALKYPALLFFYADKDLGQDVSIVNHKDDGTYEIIPTRVSIQDGKTVLVAQVSHFSDYSARLVDPQVKQQALDKASQEPKDYNWVIYVKDYADADSGGMKRRVNLDFKAVNTSGDIAGAYKGYAHAFVTNDAEMGGGRIDADFQVKDDNVMFELGPYIELASLVPEDPNAPLAPLEPEKMPDFIGNGTVNMSGSGSGTVTARGVSVGRGLEATNSHDPFSVVVVGPLVRFSVTPTGSGTLYFDGYIRGEGK